jgi:hypothetical protein
LLDKSEVRRAAVASIIGTRKHDLNKTTTKQNNNNNKNDSSSPSQAIPKKEHSNHRP